VVAFGPAKDVVAQYVDATGVMRRKVPPAAPSPVDAVPPPLAMPAQPEAVSALPAPPGGEV
jgi:hypothetical protein